MQKLTQIEETEERRTSEQKIGEFCRDLSLALGTHVSATDVIHGVDPQTANIQQAKNSIKTLLLQLKKM